VWPDVARRYAYRGSQLAEGVRTLFRKAGLETAVAAPEGTGRRARVVQYGFHSLRHTYVTLMEDAGVDRETIQPLVGHGSPVMTSHYSHSEAATARAKGVLPALVERRD